MICDEAEVFASGLYVACFGLEFFAREVQVQFLTAKFQSMYSHFASTGIFLRTYKRSTVHCPVDEH